MSYTKNEIALETLISNVNNFFYFVGEDDDKIPYSKTEVRNRLSLYCSEFVKLYDILRDMDFELTPLQESVFEKIEMGVDKIEI